MHDHSRHPHGTWGAGMRTLRGYVQSHQVDTKMLGPEQRRYECVAEMWLDGPAHLESLSSDPILTSLLVPDAPNFLDTSRPISFAATEEVIRATTAEDPGFDS